MSETNDVETKRTFIDLTPDAGNLFETFFQQMDADLRQWAKHGQLPAIEPLHRLLGPLVIALEATNSPAALERVKKLLSESLTAINARHMQLDREEEAKYCAECGELLSGSIVPVTWDDEPGLVSKMHRLCAEAVGKA